MTFKWEERSLQEVDVQALRRFDMPKMLFAGL
jgi:hypothetical protein